MHYVAGTIALANDETVGDEVGLEEVIDIVLIDIQLPIPETHEGHICKANVWLEKIFTEVILLSGASCALY